MRYFITFLTCIILISLPGTIHGQMIANITEDIQTEFGVYHPYPADFTPSVPVYTVQPDFSDVTNFSDFEYFFNENDLAFLSQNHFTVKKSSYSQLFDIYNQSTWDGKPIFVTTDAVLHIYHVLYDKMLAEIEIQKFVDDLDDLTSSLIQETESLYEQETKPETKEAGHRNRALLLVAQKLLQRSS